MITQYRFIIILFFFIIGSFCFLSWISDQYIAAIDKQNYSDFEKGITRYQPKPNGLDWETNQIYNEVNNLSSGKNIFLYGSSTTREGILPDRVNIPNNWTVHNFGIRGASIQCFKMLSNYLNSYSNHKPDKNDIIAVHICYPIFVDKPSGNENMKTFIEKSGEYIVDESENVTGTTNYLLRIWELGSEKIYNSLFLFIWDGAEFSLKNQIYSYVKSLFIRHDIISQDPNAIQEVRGSMNIDDFLKQFDGYWENLTRNTSYPGHNTQKFIELIDDLNNQSNVVIIDMYITSRLRNSTKEAEYSRWVNNELVPHLNERKIPYINFTSSIPDIEYADSSHLLINGRDRYTDLFNKEITKIITNISVSEQKAKKVKI